MKQLVSHPKKSLRRTSAPFAKTVLQCTYCASSAYLLPHGSALLSGTAVEVWRVRELPECGLGQRKRRVQVEFPYRNCWTAFAGGWCDRAKEWVVVVVVAIVGGALLFLSS